MLNSLLARSYFHNYLSLNIIILHRVLCICKHGNRKTVCVVGLQATTTMHIRPLANLNVITTRIYSFASITHHFK